MFLQFQNGPYRIQSDRFGNILLSIDDKRVYLQGEDAHAFRKTLEGRSTRMFIGAIEDYSEVMRDSS